MRLSNDIFQSRATLPAFAIQGYALGAFAALVPPIKSGIAAGDAVFGVTILCSAAGALAAMSLAAPVDRRLGALSLPLAALAFLAALVGAAMAPGVLVFAMVMLLAGAASGFLDVVMNARVSEIEARHARPLMSLNHAGFSLAYAVSAVATGAAREAGFGPVSVFVALFVLTVAMLPLIRLPSSEAGRPVEGGKGGLGALALWAGGITLIAFVAENATESWSALHVERTLGGGAAEGALGPAMLGLTMAVGRFLGHVVSLRGREARLIALAAILAALGAGIAAAAPTPHVAYVGFATLGLGVSVIAPLAIGLAGALAAPGRRTQTVSRVVMIGFVGFFIGPPLMGLVSEAAGLRASFGCVALLLVAIPPMLIGLRRATMP